MRFALLFGLLACVGLVAATGACKKSAAENVINAKRICTAMRGFGAADKSERAYQECVEGFAKDLENCGRGKEEAECFEKMEYIFEVSKCARICKPE